MVGGRPQDRMLRPSIRPQQSCTTLYVGIKGAKTLKEMCKDVKRQLQHKDVAIKARPSIHQVNEDGLIAILCNKVQ